MPIYKWLGASWGDLAMVVVSAVGIYLAVVVYTRIVGLRSAPGVSSGFRVIEPAVLRPKRLSKYWYPSWNTTKGRSRTGSSVTCRIALQATPPKVQSRIYSGL